MKSVVNSEQPTTITFPYIGVSKISRGKTVLFTEPTLSGKARGIILNPGVAISSRKIGDWVTYPTEFFPPLVGTITLEN